MKKRIIRINTKGKRKLTKEEGTLTGHIQTKFELAKALILLCLITVSEKLKEDVEELAGERYCRNGGKPGIVVGEINRTRCIYPTKKGAYVPRVGNMVKKEEVSLENYRILLELSYRNLEAYAESLPEAFGMSPSKISRRFIKINDCKLKELMEKNLSQYNFVTLFIDGKSSDEDEMTIASGVRITEEKIPMGFIQAGTENKAVIKDFLNGLIERALNINNGMLCLINGAKGLRSGIKKVFRDKALIQRCQRHKRENVVGYLPKSQRAA